jgi:hypothetical protein
MVYFILEHEGVKQGVIPQESVYWRIIDNNVKKYFFDNKLQMVQWMFSLSFHILGCVYY